MRRTTQGYQRPTAAVATAIGLAMALAGCRDSSSSGDDGNEVRTGHIAGIPIEGLAFTTDTTSGTTDAAGRFQYRAGETVSFSVGELMLGSTTGGKELTPVAWVDAAGDLDHNAVANQVALLQTLDHDGDLNNGIQITATAAGIVSDYADLLVFDLAPAAFAETQHVNDLLAALNAAGEAAFNDTDPRARRLRIATDKADSAIATLRRALSERRTVSTNTGDLRGFATADGRAWSWYGVPYAAPPLGERRWRPPVDREPWDGVRDAIAWGDQSAQAPTVEPFGEGGMSEDSLYLNVTTPVGHEDEQLPVMVWFHGGGFVSLTGNTQSFNNTSLPSEDVIVVTVNHRLGPFGYFAHPALTGESDYGGSGNYGQLDLVKALEWVQANIDLFGGDPNNVTIFGESGGGGKVLSLLHSPRASGLFHRAIVQSGMDDPDAGPVRFPIEYSLEQHEAEGERFVEALGLNGSADELAALRDLTWLELVEVGYDEEQDFGWFPNIDGYYTEQGIRQAFEAGNHNDVPIMAGANTGDYPDLMTGVEWYMEWMPDANESDIFVYSFDHVPAGWQSAGTQAYHGIELVYVFDYPGSFFVHYLLGLSGHEEPTPAKFATTHSPSPDPYEYSAVSGTALAMWSSFARTGDPSLPALPWPAYTPEGDQFMRITVDSRTETGLENAFP